MESGVEWKEGGVHCRVTSLGWSRQSGLYLLEGGLQFCDWNDNGVMATPGRVDCWTGKVTIVARGK